MDVEGKEEEGKAGAILSKWPSMQALYIWHKTLIDTCAMSPASARSRRGAHETAKQER